MTTRNGCREKTMLAWEDGKCRIFVAETNNENDLLVGLV